MSIKEGDRVAVKPGGRAEYTLFDNRHDSAYRKHFEEADTLAVWSIDPKDGDVGVFAGDRRSWIARDQLVRVFVDEYREGQKVVLDSFGVKGTVIDVDPKETTADRATVVPVRVDAIFRSDLGVVAGSTLFVEPQFLRPGDKLNLSATLPRAMIEVDPKLIRNAAKQAVTLSQRSTLHDVIHTDPPAPEYDDVTAESSWRNLQRGDIVTAEHKTRHVSGWNQRSPEVINSRTSEVVWRDGHLHWIELELSPTQPYDSYTITKVLRPRPIKAASRSLFDRRKPATLRITRTVPADGVWPETTRTTTVTGVVEHDTETGWSWLYVTESMISGDNAGKKLRIKENRDKVEYLTFGQQWHAAGPLYLEKFTHHEV